MPRLRRTSRRRGGRPAGRRAIRCERCGFVDAGASGGLRGDRIPARRTADRRRGAGRPQRRCPARPDRLQPASSVSSGCPPRPSGGFAAPQPITDRTDVGMLAIADLNRRRTPRRPRAGARQSGRPGDARPERRKLRRPPRAFEIAGSGDPASSSPISTPMATSTSRPPARTAGRIDPVRQRRWHLPAPHRPRDACDAGPADERGIRRDRRRRSRRQQPRHAARLALLLGRADRTFDQSRSVPTSCAGAGLAHRRLRRRRRRRLAAGAVAQHRAGPLRRRPGHVHARDRTSRRLRCRSRSTPVTSPATAARSARRRPDRQCARHRAVQRRPYLRRACALPGRP